MSDANDMETRVLPPAVPPQDPDMKPRWVKPTVVAGSAVLVVALVAGGVIWHARATEDARQRALAACQTAIQAAGTAKTAYEQTQKDTQEAGQITADQVTDASLVDAFKAQTTPTVTVPACPSDADKATLDESKGRADAVKTSYETATRGLKAAADQVVASRDQKTLDTAKAQVDQTRTDGQTLYDQSANRVADENTRTTLKAALDGVKTDTVDDANASIQAIRSAMDQVNASIQAKTDADNAAQAEAQRQTETNSGSSSNNGSTTRRNTSGSNGSSSKNNGGSANSNKSNNSNNSGGSSNNNGSTNSGNSNGGEEKWFNAGTWTNGELTSCPGTVIEIDGQPYCTGKLG